MHGPGSDGKQAHSRGRRNTGKCEKSRKNLGGEVIGQGGQQVIMRFICDAMLGKLAKYLRILGLDTVYIKNMNELTPYCSSDYQFFFTRRRLIKGNEPPQSPSPDPLPRRGEGMLLPRSKLWGIIRIDRVVFIISDKAMEQIREIQDIIRPYVDLKKAMTRCIKCNTPLAPIKKIDVEQYIPEFVFHQYETFSICPSCRNIYWEGSHTAHMARFAEEIFG
ncbi:MAG: hypothetical protein C0392_00145 [Syntrophus sp. (in: bacteria)]|nr:hypothetical protein [Syntrophus sp. (in: bacteria)]